MAPLKRDPHHGVEDLVRRLPCLKRHGSIEARAASLALTGAPRFLPCLKRHGSIEADGEGRGLLARPRLPCLKRHGSIEAGSDDEPAQGADALTMSEKTWLH